MARWRVECAASAVLIVGMHRSGTSCLTGCLEDAGLALGDVNRRAPHNLKGNLENQRVMALHEDLLAQAGGSWHSPPPEVTWNQEHRERRDEIIADYQGLGTFGIKDPRTLLVLEGWIEALPNLGLVGTFRHPAAVARSLQARNGFSVGRGMRLWAYYNRLLLEYHADFAFDLISFDLPPEDYRRRLGTIARGLALEPLDGGSQFFDAQLRNAGTDLTQQMPSDIARILSALHEASAEHG